MESYFSRHVQRLSEIVNGNRCCSSLPVETNPMKTTEDESIEALGGKLTEERSKTTRKQPKHREMARNEPKLLIIPPPKAFKEYRACDSRGRMILTAVEL